MPTTIKLKSSVVKGRTPDPASLAIGEIAVGAHSETPALYFRDNQNNLITIEPGSGVVPSPTPPATPSAGDLWYNEETTGLNYWNGFEWVELGQAGDSPVTSVNGDIGIVVLDAADVGALADGNWSSYGDGVEVEDDDLFVVSRGGVALTIPGSEIGGGGTPKPVDPTPNEIAGPVSGTGTQLDPFILSSASVDFGQAAVSAESITITGQKAGALVIFEDANAGTNGTRYSQSTGIVGADGTWTSTLNFNDSPASTGAGTYVGLLNLFETEIYFQWDVGVEANATIAKPSVLAPPDGAGIGGDVTYTPRTSAVSSVVGDVLTLADSKSYNNADGADMGQPISETFTAGQTVTASGTTLFAATEPAFSTTLYTGTETSRLIETGVNNTGKSLIWLKNREQNQEFFLSSDVLGGKYLSSDRWDALSGAPYGFFESFDSTGVTISGAGQVNGSGKDFVAWNWRVAPKFFDVQTFIGDGVVGREIPHNLTVKPGMFIIKNLDISTSWIVSHKFLDPDVGLYLDQSGVAAKNPDRIRGSSATTITVGNSTETNAAGGSNYVVYLFADEPGLIKCDGYSGNNTTRTIDLGFKPQWILIKNVSDPYDWYQYDVPRGWTVDDGDNQNQLLPNTNAPENDASPAGGLRVSLTASGFQLYTSDLNKPGQDYIYMAIAENAVAPPAAATGTVASAINNILTLTDTGGTWSAGDFAVNDTEVTKTGPGADVLEFVGSTPQDVPADSVSTWGDATWQVSADVGFSSPMVGTKLITNSDIPQTLDEDERGAIVLADDTQYWARVKYVATSPDVASSYSTAVTFKTAAASGPPAVDDAFASRVYTGNSGTQSIVNGIDNSGKALAWFKGHEGFDHQLYDTVRGFDSLDSATVSVPFAANDLVSYNSDGVTIQNTTGWINKTGQFQLWNFRAAPKFFDVQTWSGDNASSRAIPHSLTTTPGFIVTKTLANAQSWVCYHKELGTDKYIMLNKGDSPADNTTWLDSVSATDFVTGSNNGLLNESGEEYVAYLFADEPGLIKCGGFTSNGGDQPIDLGFTPQWVLIKRTNGSGGDWLIFDNTLNPQKSFSTNTGQGILNTAGQNRVIFSENQLIIDNVNMGWSAGDEIIYVAIAAGTPTTFFDPEAFQALNEHQVERRFGTDPNKVNTNKLPVNRLTNEPTGVTATFVEEGDKYRPIEDQTGTVNRLNNEVNEAQVKVENLEKSVRELKVKMAKDEVEERLLARIEALEAKKKK